MMLTLGSAAPGAIHKFTTGCVADDLPEGYRLCADICVVLERNRSRNGLTYECMEDPLQCYEKEPL